MYGNAKDYATKIEPDDVHHLRPAVDHDPAWDPCEEWDEFCTFRITAEESIRIVEEVIILFLEPKTQQRSHEPRSHAT